MTITIYFFHHFLIGFGLAIHAQFAIDSGPSYKGVGGGGMQGDCLCEICQGVFVALQFDLALRYFQQGANIRRWNGQAFLCCFESLIVATQHQKKVGL